MSIKSSLLIVVKVFYVFINFSFSVVCSSGSKIVITSPAALELSGKLLEMQMLRPHSRPTESETLGIGSGGSGTPQSVLTSPPRVPGVCLSRKNTGLTYISLSKNCVVLTYNLYTSSHIL